MGMLHQDLADAVFLGNELAVVLHQDGLALGRIVRLVLLRIAAQLAAGALEVIQAADLRRAAGDPDHAGPELRAEAGKNIVIDVLVLFPDQRHGADLAYQIKFVFHIPVPPAGLKTFSDQPG